MTGEGQWPAFRGQLGFSHSASLSSCLDPADQLAASLGEKCRKPWLPSFPRKAGITLSQPFWLWLRAVCNQNGNELMVLVRTSMVLYFRVQPLAPTPHLCPVLNVPWASTPASSLLSLRVGFCPVSLINSDR